MVVVISKEDLAGSVTAIPTTQGVTPALTGSTNILSQINATLSQVDMLLKNPIIQNVLYKFLGRFNINPQQPATVNSTSTVAGNINSQNVYDLVLGSIDTVLKTLGDVPLSQVKNYFVGNKEEVIKLIDNAMVKKVDTTTK